MFRDRLSRAKKWVWLFEIKLVTKHDFSGFFRNLGNPDIASTRSLSRTRPHPSIRNFRILVSKPLYLPGVSLSLSLWNYIILGIGKIWYSPFLLEIQKLSIIRFNRIRSLKLLKFVVNRIWLLPGRTIRIPMPNKVFGAYAPNQVQLTVNIWRRKTFSYSPPFLLSYYAVMKIYPQNYFTNRLKFLEEKTEGQAIITIFFDRRNGITRFHTRWTEIQRSR